jgi:chromosome segregation ATPase
MARRTAPVKNTCPDIDSVIDTVESAVRELNGISDQMEELRTANAALRGWGEDLVKELDDVEDERDDLQRKVDEKDHEIDNLRDQIKQLEDEIDRLNDYKNELLECRD